MKMAKNQDGKKPMAKEPAALKDQPGAKPPRASANGNKHYDLRLYVAGETNKSVLALRNLRNICEEYLPGRYSIEVIDLIKKPQLAKGHQILAIPTLVREIPEPLRKIIGDLSNLEKVLVGLDILPSDGK